MSKQTASPILPPMPQKSGLMPSFSDAASGHPQPAFTKYCEQFPDAGSTCTPHPAPLAAPLALTPEIWQTLNLVNRNVNGNGDPADKIIYPKPKPYRDPVTHKTRMLEADDAIYGPGAFDVYANPLSVHYKGPRQNGFPLGDCEDFSLAKQFILAKRHHIPPENLLLALVSSKGYGPLDHAVLLVHTDRGTFVLDNSTDEVKLLEDTPYHVHETQDRTNPQTFVRFSTDGETLSRSVNDNTITKSHTNTPLYRMAREYTIVQTPPTITVSSEGWTCKATGPFIHHKIAVGTSVHSVHNSTTNIHISVEIDHDRDSKNPTTRYRSFDQDHKQIAEIVVSTADKQALGKTRSTNPQIQTIIATLEKTGITCQPDNEATHPAPLPAPHLINRFAEEAVKDIINPEWKIIRSR